jgi:hypothetical protein
MEKNTATDEELNLLSPEARAIVAELDEFILEGVLTETDEFGREEIHVFRSPIPEGEKAELRKLIIRAFEAGAGVEKGKICGYPRCPICPSVYVARRQ